MCICIYVCSAYTICIHNTRSALKQLSYMEIGLRLILNPLIDRHRAAVQQRHFTPNAPINNGGSRRLPYNMNVTLLHNVLASLTPLVCSSKSL